MRRIESFDRMVISLFLFCRFFGGLFGTRRAQRVRDGMISFVAGILEQLITGFLRDGKSDSPRSGIRLGIIDSHFIVDPVRSSTCKPFHKPERIAVRSAAVTIGSDGQFVADEVRGLDDQSVAFPM